MDTHYATFAAANWKKGVRYAPFAGVSSKGQKPVLLNKTMFLGLIYGEGVVGYD